MAGFTETNREHWDSHAKTYNDNNEKTLERLIGEIRSRLDWIGVDFLDDDEGSEEDDELADADERANETGGDGGEIKRKTVRLLDYACGTGMVSRALAPYVSQVQGMDLSSGMVSVYNANARNQGLSPSEMSAAVGNLLDPDSPWPAEFKDEKWFNFDLAVVGHGFHHFEEPTLAATRLAQRLRPGGVLMIMDFLPHDHDTTSDNGAAEGSGTHGNGQGSSHEYSHDPRHGHGIHGVGHVHSHSFGHSHDDKSQAPVLKATHTVAHFGFSEEDIQKYFEAAGVGKDFAFEVVAKGVVFAAEGRKMTRNVFMARGTKGGDTKI